MWGRLDPEVGAAAVLFNPIIAHQHYRNSRPRRMPGCGPSTGSRWFAPGITDAGMEPGSPGSRADRH